MRSYASPTLRALLRTQHRYYSNLLTGSEVKDGPEVETEDREVRIKWNNAAHGIPFTPHIQQQRGEIEVVSVSADAASATPCRVCCYKFDESKKLNLNE